MIASLNPIVAKIRPTSPRGTMPRPTRSRSPGDPNIPAAAASFPSTAMTKRPPAMASTDGFDELTDVDLDPDRKEEDRDEEMADRLEITTDAVGRRAATKSEAGDERTNDRSQLRNLGELCDRQRERQRAAATNVPDDLLKRAIHSKSRGTKRMPTAGGDGEEPDRDEHDPEHARH